MEKWSNANLNLETKKVASVSLAVIKETKQYSTFLLVEPHERPSTRLRGELGRSSTWRRTWTKTILPTKGSRWP